MISLSKFFKINEALPIQAGKKIVAIKEFSTAFDSLEQASAVNEWKDNIIIKKAKLEAQEIISNAQIQANEMYKQLQNEREAWVQDKIALEERAYDDGFRQGQQEGMDKGYQEYQKLIALAKDIIATAKDDCQKHIHTSEKIILQLGMATAEKIIGETLSEREEIILPIVKRALNEARDCVMVELFVHPKHYHFLRSESENLMSVFPKESDLYIIPDDKLQPDNCIIETELGRIDASIDTQLNQIKTRLFELLESE